MEKYVEGVGIDYVEQQDALHVCGKSGSIWGMKGELDLKLYFSTFCRAKTAPGPP